jgi:hypothetical protein
MRMNGSETFRGFEAWDQLMMVKAIEEILGCFAQYEQFQTMLRKDAVCIRGRSQGRFVSRGEKNQLCLP